MDQETLYKLATDYATAVIVSKYNEEFRRERQNQTRKLKEQYQEYIKENPKGKPIKKETPKSEDTTGDQGQDRITDEE